MSNKPSKEKIRLVRILFAVAIAAFCIHWLALNFLSADRIRLTVEKMSAAEHCREPMRRRARLQVSAHPKSVVRCGDVITDKGQFLLPRTKLHLFDLQINASIVDTRRATLYALLKPGCRYEVKIVGYGNGYRKRRNGRPVISNRVNHRISKIYAELGCDP